MRIAYFTESLPPNTDGVVNTLCHLIETLESENVEFLFFSPLKPDEDVAWSRHVRKVASLSLKPYFHYRVGLPNFYRINEEMDDFQPDLIHVVTPSPLGMHGLNYAKRKNVPLVTSYHTHFTRYFAYYSLLASLEPLGWQYLQWFHNQCDCTYAPSMNTVRELQGRGIRNVQLWQRGIDLTRFSPKFRNPALRESINAGDKPVLLFVGRLVKEKDLDDLVAANHLLQSMGLDFKQVIVGDGPIRNELEKNLPDAHFAGYQYEQNLSEWYASSDLFVFPSTTETFGNVFLEAFASGLPAIGVDKGGQVDLIDPGETGFIVRAHDPADFADNIAHLLRSPDTRAAFGLEAAKRVKRYSWQNVNLSLLNSYHNVIHLN